MPQQVAMLGLRHEMELASRHRVRARYFRGYENRSDVFLERRIQRWRMG
jgi:hypothetical protein